MFVVKLNFGREVEIRIERITESKNLSQKEQMRFDSIKKKLAIIKASKEAEEDCVLQLDEGSLGYIPIHTSLRNALLSSVSIKNGEIIQQESIQTQEQLNGQNKSESLYNEGTRISLGMIKAAIQKYLGGKDPER